MANGEEHILMTDKHKEAIRKNYEKLASNLTASSMLNKLVAENIITMEEQDKVLGEKVSSARASLLMRLLVKREDKTFYVLIDALHKYSMPHLAKLLEKADKDGCDNGHPGAVKKTAEKKSDSETADQGGETNCHSGLMTEDHKDKLEELRTKLQASMDPKVTIDKLRSYRVFTPREADEIRGIIGDENKVGEMLDRLHKKDDSAYGKLKKALQETNQKHVADIL